jgi:ankyrin repeat protein
MLKRLAQEGTYAELSAYLTDHGSSLNPKDLAVALVAAVQREDATMVKLLLEHGANPNTSIDEGCWSVLDGAVEDHSLEIVRLLVEHGADVNARSEDGFTVLHHAVDVEGDGAQQSQTTPTADLTALLLELGADPRLKTSSGKSPLDVAVQYEHTAAVALLNERLRALGE